MARVPTTADAFNAVAEPRRRQILDVLAGGERPVNDLVRPLRILTLFGARRGRLARANGHHLRLLASSLQQVLFDYSV